MRRHGAEPGYERLPLEKLFDDRAKSCPSGFGPNVSYRTDRGQGAPYTSRR